MLRDIEKRDINTIHKLVGHEWYQDLYQEDQNLADAYVNFDIQSCLLRSSFGKVAELDGKVVGVIMGRVNSKNPLLSFLADDVTDDLMTLLAAPGPVVKEIIRDHRIESETNRKLLNESPISYDGEISLFILSAEARGKGIGSKLFDSMVNYFDSNNAKNYFLYADDSCNIGFYTRRGLCQRGSIAVNHGQIKAFNYYIYDNASEK